MQYVIGAVLMLLLAGTTVGGSIINDIKRNFTQSPVVVAESLPRANIALDNYRREQEAKMAALGRKVEELRVKDDCLSDADRVRRANPDDRSLATSAGRFCGE